jgi:hypothetical protein
MLALVAPIGFYQLTFQMTRLKIDHRLSQLQIHLLHVLLNPSILL